MEEEGSDRSRSIKVKRGKYAFRHFFSSFSEQPYDDLEMFRVGNNKMLPEKLGVSQTQGFLHTFADTGDLVVALSIWGFILINPLNFRVLCISNARNVQCVPCRGEAVGCSRALVVRNRRG